MLRIIKSTVFLCLILLASNVYAGPIGIVDSEKINKALKFEGLIEISLSEDALTHNNVLLEQSSKVSALRIELNKKATSLSSEQKKTMEQDIASEQKKLEKLQRANRIRMQKLRSKIVNEINSNIEKATATVAAKHHIEKVFLVQIVLYAKDKIDLTDEIISELRKIYGDNKNQDDD